MKKTWIRFLLLTLALVMLLGIPVQAYSYTYSIRHGEFSNSYCSSFIYEGLTIWFEVTLNGEVLEPGSYSVASSNPGVVSFNEDYTEITGIGAGETELIVSYGSYTLRKDLTVYECPSITYTYDGSMITLDFSEFYSGLKMYYKAEGDELWTVASRSAVGTYSYRPTPGETYTYIMRYWDDKADGWIVVGDPLVVTIPSDEPEPELPSFTDVDTGAFYADAVRWAVEEGITTGTSSTTFSPNDPCSRAQVVTFLWRAAGKPEPSIANPFTDLDTSAYYYQAVLWAVEAGITNGYGSSDIFSPDTPCNRAQVVTFLWRMESRPAPASSVNPFRDVNRNEYYGDAVLWAVEQGITNGYGSSDIFSPETICSRGQIVTFLYRAR